MGDDGDLVLISICIYSKLDTSGIVEMREGDSLSKPDSSAPSGGEATEAAERRGTGQRLEPQVRHQPRLHTETRHFTPEIPVPCVRRRHLRPPTRGTPQGNPVAGTSQGDPSLDPSLTPTGLPSILSLLRPKTILSAHGTPRPRAAKQNRDSSASDLESPGADELPGCWTPLFNSDHPASSQTSLARWTDKRTAAHGR